MMTSRVRQEVGTQHTKEGQLHCSLSFTGGKKGGSTGGGGGGGGLEKEIFSFFSTATVTINSTIAFIPPSSLTCAMEASWGEER